MRSKTTQSKRLPSIRNLAVRAIVFLQIALVVMTVPEVAEARIRFRNIFQVFRPRSGGPMRRARLFRPRRSAPSRPPGGCPNCPGPSMDPGPGPMGPSAPPPMEMPGAPFNPSGPGPSAHDGGNFAPHGPPQYNPNPLPYTSMRQDPYQYPARPYDDRSPASPMPGPLGPMPGPNAAAPSTQPGGQVPNVPGDNGNVTPYTPPQTNPNLNTFSQQRAPLTGPGSANEILQGPHFMQAVGRCISCHATKSGVDSTYKSANSLIQALPGLPADTVERMLEEYGAGKFSHAEKEAIRDYVKRKRSEAAPESHATNDSQQSRVIEPRRFQPVAMVANGALPAYDAALKSVKLVDPRISDLLNNYDIIYDKTGMPTAHQMPNDGVVNVPGGGIRALTHDTPSPPQGVILDREGNWMDPFQHGAGIDKNTKGNSTIFVVKLPRDAQGNRMPIVKWRQRLKNHYTGANDERDSERISYPVGTEFAEVRYRNLGGQLFVHTILTRKKMMDPNTGQTYWAPDKLQPYATPESMIARIQQEPRWTENPTLVSWMQQLQAGGGRQDRIKSDVGAIFENASGGKTNQMAGTVMDLNGMTPELYQKFFAGKELESTLGARAWGMSGYPFPENYKAGCAATSVQNCKQCHDKFGRPFREVVPQTSANLAATSAYGQLGAGGDGINSFYVQDPRMLSSFHKMADNRRDNPLLTQAGLLENYNASKHGANYRLTGN